MGFIVEERLSESPFLETVTQGYTEGAGTSTRPAETHWHMVFVRKDGTVLPMIVGPCTTAGKVTYSQGVELLWVKFKLGTFMPHLPTRNALDGETTLPDASSRSFWLKGSAWQFPDFNNVETWVDRLVHEGVLVHDPLITVVLEGQPQELSDRTLRHRFLRATGLTQGHIYQVERANRAAAMLRQGIPIPDATYLAGYFDQPHLTRSLKQWIGYTPAQIIRMSTPQSLATGHSPSLTFSRS